MQTNKLPYRADIDGLRAVAVLAVIANHLPQKFLPSGFLGVDVFFVISGFVVTASLVGSTSGGGFRHFYANFLSRRVKRLLPALLVCVVITGFVVMLVDPLPQDPIKTGISALFGFANITLFNLEQDYFSPSSKLNAFTHTWSLGVEEQFYVVFPLLAWLCYLRKPHRGPRVFATTVALLSALSAVLFLWLYHVNQVAAYYLMPTRIWELGAGALVFLYADTLRLPRIGRIIGLVSPGALLALLLCFLASEQYASLVTLIAAGLTAVLLANGGVTITSNALSRRPVVYIGKISYSLYLWHWPIIALAPMTLSVDWRYSSFYVLAMMLAAVCSYHLVERPLRKAAWTGIKAWDIGLGFSCSLLLSGALLFAFFESERATSNEDVTRYPSSFLPTLNSGLPYRTCVIDKKRPLTPRTFAECTTTPNPGMPMIWAMGDSHSGHLQGMLYALHDTLGVGVHIVETPGRFFPASNGKEYPPREEIFEQVLQRLKRGDIVLISRLFFWRSDPIKPMDDLPRWVSRVSALASDLAKKGVNLVVTGPPPMFHFEDVRECDITHREYCSIKRRDLKPLIDQVLEQLYTLASENSNVFVFRMFRQLCPRDAKICYPDDRIQFLFRDEDHLNSLGSKRLAAPFEQFLRDADLLPPV